MEDIFTGVRITSATPQIIVLTTSRSRNTREHTSATMSSNAGPTVAVKLFIDKEKKRVLFAESDPDFVDILFSFLTLPLGTIVRGLGKQSQVGCLDELYKSVENLADDHFQTKACKHMLVSPRNAAAFYCNRLKVKVDDTIPRPVYVCKNMDCIALTFSSVPDAVCECGTVCQYSSDWPRKEDYSAVVGDGAFVISGQKFIITDDLHVAPASTRLMFSLIGKFGIKEQTNIEEKVLQLSSNMMISLLARSLQSKQALTGMCFDVEISPDAVNLSQLPENLLTKLANESDRKMKGIKIKVVQTKDDSSVLYAEVGHDFVDLVFGLLCIPLGSIIRAYGEWSPNGCIDNLYNSIEETEEGFVKKDLRSLLLSPKLLSFFSCSNNVLQVEEFAPGYVTMTACYICLKYRFHGKPRCNGHCSYITDMKTVCEFNPKYPSGGSAGAVKDYIKGGPRKFMVTNDLQIHHFSLANSLQAIRAAKIPWEKLVEKELTLDKTQVLKLLRAAMLTHGALSSALLPPKKKSHHLYYPGYLV